MERHNRILDFDRQWPGPEELRPRVYRTQEEKDIWNSIAVENEYRLTSLVASDVVIDIGAHIGAFSHLAHRMGSNNIYSFEIDPWHIEAAKENLHEGMRSQGIVLHHAAVVRGDEHRAKAYHYNGAWNSFGEIGPLVNNISLDEILEPHEMVRFVKIDCEGGEWPILYTCTQLHKVEEIAGEYHLDSRLGDLHAPELENLPYPRTLEALMKFLYDNGFSVKAEEHGDIGNFWAKRKNVLRPAGNHGSSDSRSAEGDTSTASNVDSGIGKAVKIYNDTVYPHRQLLQASPLAIKGMTNAISFILEGVAKDLRGLVDSD